MLCTSGFEDDIIFLQSGLYRVSCVFLSGESITIETTASIPTQFYLTIKICKHIRRAWVVHQGARSAIYDCLVVVYLLYNKLYALYNKSATTGSNGVRAIHAAKVPTNTI